MPDLIRLHEGLIVHPRFINYAWRNGNYIEVTLSTGRHESIWDPRRSVWRAILDRSAGWDGLLLLPEGG